VTSETKGDTEPWVKDKGMTYGYAYDKGARLMGKLGFTGLPSAVLLDPYGSIVWKGHPGELDEAVIKKSLSGSLTKPVFEWPASAKAARKAFAAGQVAKAIAAAKGLGTEGEELVASLEEHATASVKALNALYEGGDFLAVEERGALFTKRLVDMPQAGEVHATLAALQANTAAQPILAAQKRVQKLTSGKIKKGEIPKLREQLQEIQTEFPDTAAARDAKAELVKLTQISKS
jgi:hypothetical protein